VTDSPRRVFLSLGRDEAGTAFRFVSFYLPLWCAFAVNAFIYFKVSETLKRFAVLGAENDQRLLKMASHLRFYPAIFVVAWLGNTVVRVAQAAYGGANSDFSFALVHVLLHGTFYQSMGNAFAYGLNDSVKAKASELAGVIRSSRSLRPLLEMEAMAPLEDDFETEERPSSFRSTVEKPGL